jgi:hypothetical protein
MTFNYPDINLVSFKTYLLLLLNSKVFKKSIYLTINYKS